MQDNTQKKYWMVHRPAPNGRHPAIMHKTRNQAVDEAMRLARQHLGESFTVLSVEAAFQCPPPESPPVVNMTIVEDAASSE